MSKRLHPTLADYLVIAVSPGLIMALVGSLVFFLIDLFYQGQYPERLHFIFALFVMASVLVGRIAIEMGSSHAMRYAAPLALVTFLALQRFVQFPGGAAAYAPAVNAGLVGLILWCSQKLTWDCTFIDESLEESGEGVLRTMGLDPPGAKRPPATSTASEAQRIVQAASERPRPHSGGVWVVYFSLAALPLFGIGQRFLPPTDLDRRRYAFLLLCVYVGSALGLLLTTSFLGLRRYLRRRRLQMPASMAGVWVLTGCLLIAAILGFAAILPRPNPEYALAEVPWKWSSEQRSASPHAAGNEGTKDSRKDAATGEDHGLDHAAKNAPRQPAQRPDDARQQDDSPRGKGKTATSDRTPQGAESATGQGRGGKPDGSRDAADHVKGRSQDQGKGGSSAGEKGLPEPSRGPESASQKSPQGQTSESKGEAKAKETDKSASPRPEPKPATPQPPGAFSAWSFSPGGILKWLFYLVLFFFVAYAAWRSRAVLLQSVGEFWEALRAFWARLFGPDGGARQAAADASPSEATAAARPFASYPDPFAAGWAERWSADELIRYSFSALEAWARERGCPRAPEQTPREFADRIGDRSPRLKGHCLTMAELYCRVAYAGGTLPAGSMASLREFWQQLTSA